MKNIFLLSIATFLLMTSCTKEDDKVDVTSPETYTFLRDGSTTISYSGQTTRIGMATELINALTDFSSTEEVLLEMYRNETESGGDANPYSDNSLNESSKSIKSKVAASQDLFSTNTAGAALIKVDFENWIIAQSNEVFPNENELAMPGMPGQVADGSSVRYVNAKGLEYNQAVNKSLIGALMVDQIVNNYLSSAVLDAGENRTNNDAQVLEEGKSYTAMEHKWDEAFGYLFGGSSDPAEVLTTLGGDDNFLNKYLGRVNDDMDFEGIASEVYDAFKLGRAAIVSGNYEVRDAQAEVLRGLIAKIIAVRSVYYLQQGKKAIPADGNLNNYGAAFHDLSEGFGFIYSLQFARQPNSSDVYFTKAEVDGFITELTAGNGFWEVTPATLDAISETIASKFDFTVAQAGE